LALWISLRKISSVALRYGSGEEWWGGQNEEQMSAYYTQWHKLTQRDTKKKLSIALEHDLSYVEHENELWVKRIKHIDQINRVKKKLL